MQPMYIPPKSGKVAFQRGLIFGLIQVVVASSILLINTFVNTTADKAGIALILSGVNALLSLAAYFVAGILASKQTGKVSTGTFAGMWTGAIYGAINFVVSLVIFFQVSLPRLLDSLSNSTAVSTNPDAFRMGAIIGGVGVEIFGTLFAIGLGAGLGALGGLIGKNASKVQPVPAVPAYPGYPYQPYPGQPVPFAPYLAPAQPYPAQPAPYPQPANAEQPGSHPYMEQPH